MENEVTENNVTNENQIGNDISSEALANDTIAMAYDYYDKYYEEVTKSLSEISSREITIVSNQEQLIHKIDSLNTTCSCITFIITIIFVYNLVRNMIIVK